MKKQKEIIEDLISKLISISNISSTSNGYVSIDYRMFCDLISIARCGCNVLNKDHADKFLEQIENNVLTNINTENETQLVKFKDYKKYINLEFKDYKNSLTKKWGNNELEG